MRSSLTTQLLRSLSLAVLASLALGACSCSEKRSLHQAASVPTYLDFEGEGLFFDALGDRAQAQAIVKDQLGEAMRGVTLQWRILDPSVATVSAGGLVTSKGNGETQLEVRVEKASALLSVRVQQRVAEIELNPPLLRLRAIGDEGEIQALAVDRNGHPVEGTPLVWSSAHPSIAEVEGGLIRAMGKGVGDILVEAAEDEVSATARVTVAPEVAGLRFEMQTPWLAGEESEVLVLIVDRNGHRVEGEAAAIQLSLASAPGDGQLSGAGERKAEDGMARFPGLSIDKPGAGYTLLAKSKELEAISLPFEVLAGPPAALVFLASPAGGSRGELLVPTIVGAVDRLGNPSASELRISLALEGGPGTLHGSKQKTSSQGSASFLDLFIDEAGQGYRLLASAEGVQGASSAPFAISACTGGLLECGGACVDAQSNEAHCGACNNACGQDQLCSAGACLCTGGLQACGDLCTDTSSDPLHCGACDNPCPPHHGCEDSQCINPCPEGQFLCGTQCVDLQRDPAHCGGCDLACEGNDLCSSAQCMPDPEYANWPVPPDSPTSYTYPHSGVVLDGITKLMWERNVGNTTYTWQQAKDRCAGLELAGFKDWRLPTRIELISIVDEGRREPSINATAFPSTPYKNYVPNRFDEGFWSISPFSGNTSAGWQVNFSIGFAEDGIAKTSMGYVRCVRYGPDYPLAAALSTRYSTPGSGKVRDNRTGLVWRQQTSIGESGDYYDASFWCSGYYNARMPRRKELETLVDVRKRSPAWNAAFSGPYNNEWYWSSTDNRYGSNFKWSVDFSTGYNAATVSDYEWGAIPRCIH